jgi:CRP-like cAMP-binding protein
VVTSKPLLAQVAYLLLEMHEPDSVGVLEVRLSHATLAQLLGARRQSVTRALGELRAQGLIRSRYGATVLVDPDGLRDVMGAAPLPIAEPEQPAGP